MAFPRAPAAPPPRDPVERRFVLRLLTLTQRTSSLFLLSFFYNTFRFFFEKLPEDLLVAGAYIMLLILPKGCYVDTASRHPTCTTNRLLLRSLLLAA